MMVIISMWYVRQLLTAFEYVTVHNSSKGRAQEVFGIDVDS